jgi:hypothetical protein
VPSLDIGPDLWIPILEHRGFYDVPRLMLVQVDGRVLILDCPFDEALDDFPPDYEVIELTTDPRESLGPDWSQLSKTGSRLGYVPVASITFDPTRRRAFTSGALTDLLKSGRTLQP